MQVKRLRHVVVRSLVPLSLMSSIASTAIRTAWAEVPCRLLVDHAGDDAVVGAVRGLPSSPSLDIRSADLATDRTRLTVVIRVAELTALEVGSPTGIEYQFSTAANRRTVLFRAQVLPEGNRFTVAVTSGQRSDIGPGYHGYVAEAAGVLDYDAAEIRMTVPLAALTTMGPIRSGVTMFSRVLVSSHREAASANQVFPARSSATADSASSNAEYRAGSRNCVTVGV